MAFAAAALSACALGAVALDKAIARGADTAKSAFEVPPAHAMHSSALAEMRRDPAARAKMGAQFARLKQKAQRELSERMPKPYLADAQRQLWIAAWQRMRACAERHGFNGVSEVEPTYGDGKTAMPNVDLDQPNAQAALKACPFDPQGLDLPAQQGAAATER